MRRAALTLFVLTLALTFVLAAPVREANAAELKIGVVDVEFIIHTSKKGKASKKLSAIKDSTSHGCKRHHKPQ